MKKIFCIVLISLVVLSFAFAEGKHGFNMVADFAYYPKSEEKINEPAIHFSPINGAFSAVEARVTGNYTYTIPVPFGNNPLTKGNTLVLGGSLEISPVTLMPIATVTFTPIAFLVFETGAKFGTGWRVNLGNMVLDGIATYNDAEGNYDACNPFGAWYINTWFSGTFQFDIGAVWPGDWHHIVMQATYKAYYHKNTDAADGEVWKWQATGNYANGWKEHAVFTLGYQMPIVLKLAGVQFEIEGHFKDDYAPRYSAWNPTFKDMRIAPFAIFAFNKMHQLTIQARFTSRRSFTTDVGPELTRTFASREWTFNRIAFSYRYNIK